MEQIKVQKTNNRLSSLKEKREKLDSADDLRTEEILDANTKNPLGQLLEKISELPEVRYEKVSSVRRQICLGEYQIDEKLDVSIDKLLEELFVES